MNARISWGWAIVRGSRVRRWLLWLLHGFVVTGLGLLLLPFLRRSPEAVHTHFASQPAYQRHAALFITAGFIVWLLFKLLSPRLAHVRPLIARRYPPVWLAWLAAAVVLGLIDLTVGLGPTGFAPSAWDWAGFGVGPLAVVAVLRHLMQPPEPPEPPPVPTAEPSVDELTSNWAKLEAWLQSEKPAADDLLGNRQVARRLATYLSTGGGSVGLVGPFGSGKSSVVAWIKDEVACGRQPAILFAEQSCWGFEDSGTAVQEILARAVEAVGRQADCFSLRSLPESYRKTFSAGGDWVRSLADLTLGSSDPVKQFAQLSEVLEAVNARLVVIVEDLDRPASGRFDRQEVQALLHRLRATNRVSFVLASGRANDRDIDFAKLCDHIEILRDFDPARVAALIEAVRSRCLDGTEFLHVATVSREQSPWEPSQIGTLSKYDTVALPDAVARILRTPRALKHALRRTHRAWRALHGEVDLDHLLAVNVLRHGAPEAFDFLLRHWVQMRADPTSWGAQRDAMPRIRERLTGEWNRVTAGVEWEPRAALAVLVHLLPAADEYLGNATGIRRRGPTQGIDHQRYWLRVVNEKIDPTDVRDQTVLRDINDWRSSCAAPSALVSGLASGGDYVAVWEHFAATTFGSESSLVLVLADQVLAGYRTPRGVRALGWDGQPDPVQPVFPEAAFSALRCLAGRNVIPDDAVRDWLENQVRLAIPSSLSLVNDLYHDWASIRWNMVRPESRAYIRTVICRLAQEQLRTADDLLRVLPTTGVHYCLYQLVFPPDSEEGPSVCRGLPHWAWLGRIVLEAVRADRPLSPLEAGYLFADRQHGHPGLTNWEVDRRLLTGFFGDAAAEVIAWMAAARERFTGQDRQFLNQVVSSPNARAAEL